jgi:hypothetical protein
VTQTNQVNQLKTDFHEKIKQTANDAIQKMKDTL